MMKRTSTTLFASFLLATCAVTAGAAAQDEEPAAAGAPPAAGTSHGESAGNPFLTEQREAMARLDGWVGEWRGSGWALSRGGGGRTETTVHESVGSKLGGLAILVEGVGRTEDPETGESKVVHDALGIITYDPHGDRYVFRYYSAEGQAGEAELVPVEGGWRWGFETPGGGPEVRFTVQLGEDSWHESGEVSMDGGESWFPMLEMTLAKQGG